MTYYSVLLVELSQFVPVAPSLDTLLLGTLGGVFLWEMLDAAERWEVKPYI